MMLDGHTLTRDMTRSTHSDNLSLGSDDHLPMSSHDSIYDHEQYIAHTRNNRFSNSTEETSASQSSTFDAESSEFYNLEALDIHGNVFDFKQLKGKYVLIVNVATQCLGAHQLRDLEGMYQRFKDDGLVILGFPSNQFFQERTKAPEEIVTTCERKWNVSFPLMEKIRVNGKHQHQVFKYLKDHKRGFLHTKRVKWNYEKFLVDKEGAIIERYSSFQKPPKIEELVAKIIDEDKKQQQLVIDKSKIVLAENQRVIYI